MVEQLEQVDVSRELRMVGKSSIYFGLSRIVVGVAGLIIGFLNAKFLGPEGLGIFSLAFTIALLASRLSTFGLQAGVVKFIAHHLHRDEKPQVKGAIIDSALITTVLGVIIWVLFFLSAELIADKIFHKPELSLPLKIMSFAILPIAFHQLAVSLLRAFKLIKYQSYVLAIQKLVFLALLLAAFLMGTKVRGVIVCLEISFVAAVVMGLIYLFSLRFRLFKEIQTQHVFKTLIPYSATMLFSGLALYLIGYADILFLGFFRSLAEVGIYRLAAVLSMMCIIPLGIVNIIHAPLISEFHAKDEQKKMEKVFKIVTRWVFTLSFPAFLILVLYGGRVLALFGKDFALATPALIILASAQLINASTGSVAQILTMTKYPHLDLANNIVLLVLSVVLNLILIPAYGILGAAVATGISIAAVNLLRLIEVRYIFNIHPYSLAFIKPIIAGIASLFLAKVVAQACKPIMDAPTWPVFAILFGVFYIIIVTILRFEKEDKEILSWISARIRQKVG